jgi:glycosyltransferase involved in cell wall biosynthesis
VVVAPDLPVTVVPTVESLNRPRLLLSKLTRPRGELSRGSFAHAFELAAENADLLHLEETDTGWTADDIDRPRVLRVHYLAQLDLPVGGLVGPDPLRRGEEVLGEVLLARRHQYVVASTPEVAHRIARFSPRSTVSVAPLSVEPSHYREAPLNGPPQAGLIGTADWPPTRSALSRLVREIWPRVRAHRPDAKVLVAGRGIDRITALQAVPGLELVGEVPSAPEFLRTLSLLIYPVRRGSGMKVKVLEALATGLPVVTTPAGAEGIGPCDGVIVESDGDRLAGAVHELLTDSSARQQRGAAALAYFQEHLSPRAAAAPLVAAYSAVAARV